MYFPSEEFLYRMFQIHLSYPMVVGPYSVRRSDSVGAYPPSDVRSSPDGSVDSDGRSDVSCYDADLMATYYPHRAGRRSLPSSTPMYNKFVGNMLYPSWWRGEYKLRNIKIGLPALGIGW